MKNFKTIAIALFAALTLVSATNVMANEGAKRPKANIDLKFIGNNDNQPVFQLNVNNSVEDEYIVTFRDDQNNVLYAGRIKGANITKNFQLNTEGGVDGPMSVEVRSTKSSKGEIYKINKTTRFTEQIVVNKL